jgi:GTP-binding protein
MIIGENARGEDLTVNPCKEKKMSNMRTTASDQAIKITTPREITLESALEYIQSDELVEVTPKSIRLRKKALTELDRKRGPRDF